MIGDVLSPEVRCPGSLVRCRSSPDSGPGTPDPGSVALGAYFFFPSIVLAAWTEILFGMASAALGSRRVRTPFS